MAPSTRFSETWDKFDKVIRNAMENPEYRNVFQYGTPSQKLELLQREGLTFEDLVQIHHELENVLHNSPAKFWWW